MRKIIEKKKGPVPTRNRHKIQLFGLPNFRKQMVPTRNRQKIPVQLFGLPNFRKTDGTY